jgi:hypothetical protein
MEEIKFDYSYDLKTAKFELDVLQQEMLNFYLRADKKFRMAYNKDYTQLFIQFLKDKARLKEPIPISCMGNVRCQPKGSKVLMANGEWENIENLNIGDEVLSPQSNGKNIYSKIIGKSQHISLKNYRIFELNGTRKWLFDCSSEHIIPTLFYKFEGSARKGTKIYAYKDGINEYTANKLFKMVSHKNNRILTSFPIKKFKKRKNCEINPYFLGAFLGDGHFTQALGITNSDKNILDKLKRTYKVLNYYAKKQTKNNSCFTYFFSTTSKIAKLLTKHGLRYKKSGTKFIPKEALLSDIIYRRKLLAGLIDTDGTISKSCSYSITTKSKKMAHNILFLIQSLGGNGHIYKIRKGIKKINFIGTYYKVSFYIGKEIEKIRLLKKSKIRDIKRAYWKNSSNRLSFTMKKKKKCVVYGIELDSPSKLYITNNMVITHNSGKSLSMMSVCFLMNYLNGRIIDVRYICPNSFDYLEQIKSMTEKDTLNSCFQIDEEKNVFGVGSLAKKTKLSDVQNIIAKRNISTISICPSRFPNKEAWYGVRAFGRDFTQKVNRFMLYNLQEGEKGGIKPLGMVYIPIISKLVPEKYSKPLIEAYDNKKDEWILREQKGEGDVLYQIKRKTAEHFARDEKYKSIKKKDEKIAYISLSLGSEWARGEILEVFNIANLIINNLAPSED